MGYSTPKKQLDLKEFLAQPASKNQIRTGMAFRRVGARATGSTVTTERSRDGERDGKAE